MSYGPEEPPIIETDAGTEGEETTTVFPEEEDPSNA